MGLEIERRFLVNHEKWKEVDRPISKFFRQGYLCGDDEKIIRVRTDDRFGYLTIKGKPNGRMTPEYEYEIPYNEATELLDKFSTSELLKIRNRIIFNDKLWEVDTFLGDNQGLIIAEIELVTDDEIFDLPDWVDKEITGEHKYSNYKLSMNPFKYWKYGENFKI